MTWARGMTHMHHSMGAGFPLPRASASEQGERGMSTIDDAVAELDWFWGPTIFPRHINLLDRLDQPRRTSLRSFTLPRRSGDPWYELRNVPWYEMCAEGAFPLTGFEVRLEARVRLGARAGRAVVVKQSQPELAAGRRGRDFGFPAIPAVTRPDTTLSARANDGWPER
jgi:hypothetical protein